MKRVLLILTAAALLLWGCGQGPASSQEESPQVARSVTGRVARVSGNDFVLNLGSYGPSADSGAAREDDGEGAIPQSGEAPRQEERARPPAGNGEDGERPSGEPQGGQGGQGAGGGARFTESGQELSLRIPVGTPITYGGLKVDFSQIRLDYVIQVDYGGEQGDQILSAQILST